MSFGTRGFESLSRRPAHLGEISACFKTEGCERGSEVVKLGAELRHRDTTTAAVKDIVVTVAKTEEQDRAKEDYESLDRLIDSITRDFSRKGINSSLKALARKTGSNASLAKKEEESLSSLIGVIIIAPALKKTISTTSTTIFLDHKTSKIKETAPGHETALLGLLPLRRRLHR
jgi:hypothetical protein